MAMFDGFHEKLQETIKASAEWAERSQAQKPAAKTAAAPAGTAFDDMDSDVPF